MFTVLLGNWEMKTYHYVTKSVNPPNPDNIFGALMEAFTEDAVPWSFFYFYLFLLSSTYPKRIIGALQRQLWWRGQT